MSMPVKQIKTVYDAFLEVPSHKVAQIINGELHVMSRPRPRHKKILRTITTHLRKDIGTNTTSRPFEMVELPDNVFRLAETLLLEQAKFSISSNDA